MKRPPSTPGEVLLKEFLKPKHLTQVELARRMGIPVQRVNTIITGKRSVTAETALLLSHTLKTSAEFWMNLQTARDLYTARMKLK